MTTFLKYKVPLRLDTTTTQRTVQNNCTMRDTTGNRVTVNSGSGVQIPISPPYERTLRFHPKVLFAIL